MHPNYNVSNVLCTFVNQRQCVGTYVHTAIELWTKVKTKGLKKEKWLTPKFILCLLWIYLTYDHWLLILKLRAQWTIFVDVIKLFRYISFIQTYCSIVMDYSLQGVFKNTITCWHWGKIVFWNRIKCLFFLTEVTFVYFGVLRSRELCHFSF